MWEDDNDSEWDESDEEEFQRMKRNRFQHPLMQKALEIIKLTQAIVGSLDEARTELYGGQMMESAMILASKFSGAEAMENYVHKMENAVQMKLHARSLSSMSYQLALEGTHAEEHLQLLRDGIEEFRKLFITWVKGFDKSKREDDGWGVFMD